MTGATAGAGRSRLIVRKTTIRHKNDGVTALISSSYNFGSTKSFRKHKGAT
jgi:hypothetical protein